MSDYLAVAGVSAVLKSILDNALQATDLSTALGAPPTVSVLPPDRIVVGADEAPQLNLFLYNVRINPAWRNNDLPWHDARGQRLSNAPLPLSLHYFLTAYGKNEFDCEILLGWAMQVLHETPILTPDVVQSTLQSLVASGGASVPSEVMAVAATTLPQQIELVRITPEVLTMDDLSKLWTAFQAKYRATTAYQASVVLIRSTLPVKSALPVQTRNIAVQPFQPPIIDALASSFLAIGETLTIKGRNFIGDAPSQTNVSFDGDNGTPPDTIQSTIAKLALPASLSAGVREVQIVRDLDFGIPTDPHRGYRSNTATFMLLPTITGAVPASIQAGTTLTLTLNPVIGRDQRVVLLIGGQGIEMPSRPPDAPATSATVAIAIPKNFPVSAAGQVLRICVDGAESRIAQDSNSASPTFGQFLPQIAVTPP